MQESIAALLLSKSADKNNRKKRRSKIDKNHSNQCESKSDEIQSEDSFSRTKSAGDFNDSNIKRNNDCGIRSPGSEVFMKKNVKNLGSKNDPHNPRNRDHRESSNDQRQHQHHKPSWKNNQDERYDEQGSTYGTHEQAINGEKRREGDKGGEEYGNMKDIRSVRIRVGGGARNLGQDSREKDCGLSFVEARGGKAGQSAVDQRFDLGTVRIFVRMLMHTYSGIWSVAHSISIIDLVMFRQKIGTYVIPNIRALSFSYL